MSDLPLFVDASLMTLQTNKSWADRAIAQVSDEQLRIALHQDTNSIVVVMKHVAGNLLSRWTDFLTTDGEKEWRDRDSEFIDDFEDREEAIASWEKGWDCLFRSLKQLTEDDLQKTVTIRGELHTVPLAIQRSLGHTCYHIGQIVMMSRVLCTTDWQVITIPRGKSGDHNARVWGQDDFRSHHPG